MDFVVEAGRPSPGHLDLMLALSREFGRVGAAQTYDLVAEIAEAVAPALERPQQHQVAALGEAMRPFRRIADDLGLDDLRVDRVLARRAGSEAVLVAVAVEAGRAAGMRVRAVGDDRRHLVVHDDLPGLVLDPDGWRLRPIGPAGRRELRPRCAHQLAFAVLAVALERLARAGDIGRALHAAELRLALPLAEPLRARVEAERDGLRASLN